MFITHVHVPMMMKIRFIGQHYYKHLANSITQTVRRIDYTSGKKTFVYSESTRPKEPEEPEEPEEPDVSIARERAQKLLSCAQKTVSAAHQRLKEPLRAL